jgi:hypothetical protein
MRKMLYLLLFLGLAGPLTPLTGQAQLPDRTLKGLMIDKVKNAQLVLEGLALEDFGKVRRGAQELIRISNTAEWLVRKTPQYKLFSNEFRRAAEALVQKAKDKNPDGVAVAYGDLVRTCVRCHHYIRDVREARLRGRGSEEQTAFTLSRVRR